MTSYPMNLPVKIVNNLKRSTSKKSILIKRWIRCSTNVFRLLILTH